jgi:hypothetical protein
MDFNMKLFITSVACVFAMMIVDIAYAADDYGVHNKYDTKVNLGENTHTDIRVTPEFVFSNNADGFRQAYVRIGPSFRLVEGVTLGVSSFTSLQRAGQDVGVEVQPEFSFRLTNFLTFNDRNRLMYRPLTTVTTDNWKYANELKLNYDVKNNSFVPFVSDELFIASDTGINQNRLIAGCGYRWNTNRVDVGYMLRTEETKSVWANSHFLYVSLFSAR